MQEIDTTEYPQKTWSNAEYGAYFNTYSPYATQGMAEQGVVTRSPEGWKIAGIAWYWWGVGTMIMAGIFFSVRRGILRRNSVLSN
jgi:hypothetical protein